MANKIQIRRGLKADIPTGSAGEPLYATDTRELYVGTGSGNVNMGGSHWYTGTAMSGATTTTDYYSYSACPEVKVDDMYLNTTYGYVYACTTAGSGATAKWTYKGSIRGVTGATGATGAAGADGTESATIVLTSSGSISSAISSLPSNGGKIILREGTYTVSSAITCDKNVIIEGMGDGTIINCTSHAFLNNTSTGYRIEIKNIKFNLTGTLTAASPFISCADSDLVLDGVSVNAVTTGISGSTADYITSDGNILVKGGTLTIDARTSADCTAFIGTPADGKRADVTECYIELYNNYNSSSYSSSAPYNLYILRDGGLLSKCSVVCRGKVSSSGNNAFACVVRAADVSECIIDLKDDYAYVNSNADVQTENNKTKFTNNTVYYNKGYVKAAIVSGNKFVQTSTSTDSLYFNGAQPIVTNNRFINSAENSIVGNAYTIFKNNALKYSCTVTSSTGAIVSDNVVYSSLA